MYYKRIAQIEREFFNTPHTFRVQKRIIAFGQQKTMEIYECEPSSGRLDYFYPEEVEKKRIVLHFTAGQLRGDIITLTGARGKVSVPFVIARDGKIYRLFSSKYWSYHLGKGTVGGNTSQSQQTIGIELSNFGPLHRIDDKLYTWTNEVYCGIQDVRQFTQLDQPYRGYTYFANYTQAQYESLKVLLDYLTTSYNIPFTFLPEPLRYTTSTQVLDFRGIVSHINYRRDKIDIGPAFDWNELLVASKPRPRTMVAILEPMEMTETSIDQGKMLIVDQGPLIELEGLGL